MGKIDFNALKRQERAMEVEESSNPELEEAYAKVWGKVKSNEVVEEIPIEKLVAYKNRKGKKQPFKLNKEKVSQIAASAKDIGILTPLIVRILEDGTYQVLAGHHRLAAAKQIKLTTVPCVLRKVSDEDAERYVIETNIQRVKLLPTEYGEIFARYMDMRKDLDLTVQEIADKFGVARKTMYRYRSVMECIEPLQDLFDEGKIYLDTADTIAALPKEKQEELVEVIQSGAYGEVFNPIALSRYLADDAVMDTSGEAVPVSEPEKPKKRYKNKVYLRVYESYGNLMGEITEEEIDGIVEDLLVGYFTKQN